MIVSMQKNGISSDLTFQKWDVAIAGESVDDRGRAAVAFAKANSDEIVEVQYDAMTFEMLVRGERINAEDIGDQLKSIAGKTVVLEATTLGFVETFMVCRALRAHGLTRLSFLYVEPLNYTAPQRSQVLYKRDFDLSETVPGYRAIPGATLHLSALRPHHAVFLLGYEEHRLEIALEELRQTLGPEDCSVVLGVPAFQPGWEMNSFANNVRVIRGKDVSGGIHFCGAENPAAAIDVLNEIRNSLRVDTRMVIAPIGTKPMGIASALFATENPNVGLIYDHPKRRPGRSSNSSSWHLFDASF